MKELKPLLRHRYLCDFCKHKVYFMKSACQSHEDKCYKNPNRNCPTCQNTGVEQHDILDPVTLGVIPDGREEVCSACKIAAVAGGKSYITND